MCAQHFHGLPWPCNIVTSGSRQGAEPLPNQNQVFEPNQPNQDQPIETNQTNQNHNQRTDHRRRRFGRHGVWGGRLTLEKLVHFLAVLRVAARSAVTASSPTNSPDDPFLETAAITLDVSTGGSQGYLFPAVVSALATVTLSSPDTVLYQCSTSGNLVAQNSQLVATLVGGIN